MEITKFIKSKAIADYLSKINYKFTPFEAAYILYKQMGINKTLKERHAVSEEIITALSASQNDKDKELCKFLKDYMEWENNLIAEIYSDDKASYEYELLGCKSNAWYCSDQNYDNISVCLDGALNKMNDVNRTEDDEIVKIVICKQYYEPKRRLRLEMNVQGEILYPQIYIGYTEKEEEQELRFYTCEVLRDVEFPLPFKAGDILYESNGVNDVVAQNMAVLYIVLKEIKNGKYVFFVVDSIEGNCSTEQSSMNDMLSYEYYHGNFSGCSRLAKVVSEYVKGKIELSDLFAIRDIIKLEGTVNKIKDYLPNKELKLLKTRHKGLR